LVTLQKEADAKGAKCTELDNAIKQLEENIIVYKEEYGQLVAQTERIKADLVNVEEKVNRSIDLIQSLNEESKRWTLGKENFSARYDTLVSFLYIESNLALFR
jgi:dynein heavy chain 1